ncbi:hypothetical protein [Cysteiniphilum litorale]|uniref:hypothetical protein n=1 Tax=Cysteiniphilum litorale TaxID=2056700 RepID=UPI003F885521
MIICFVIGNPVETVVNHSVTSWCLLETFIYACLLCGFGLLDSAVVEFAVDLASASYNKSL